MENNFSEEAKDAMKGGAGWMKFYAITMLVFIALGLIIGLLAIASGDERAILVGAAIFIACGFMTWVMIVLLQYATKLSRAASGDGSALDGAFSKQKVYFIVAGILGILGLLGNLINFF